MGSGAAGKGCKFSSVTGFKFSSAAGLSCSVVSTPWLAAYLRDCVR